jgi:hypothetical protein
LLEFFEGECAFGVLNSAVYSDFFSRRVGSNSIRLFPTALSGMRQTADKRGAYEGIVLDAGSCEMKPEARPMKHASWWIE